MGSPCDDPDYVPPPDSPDRPITSHADFFRTVNDALYQARRAADADSSAWVYQSIIGLLESMMALTSERQRPEPAGCEAIRTALSSLRTHADPTGAELLDGVEKLCAYMLEWPLGPSHADESAQLDDDVAEGQPIITSLDVVALAIHRLDDDLDKAARPSRKRSGENAALARAMQGAARSVKSELKEMMSSIEQWVKTGCPPAEHEAKRASGLETSRELARYLPQKVNAILQVRGSFSAWRKSFVAGTDMTAPRSFGDFVSALHHAIGDCETLLKLSPDHEGFRKIGENLDSIHHCVCRWVVDLAEPDDRQGRLAETLGLELDLRNWPQLSSVQRGVRQLVDLLACWSLEVLPHFRKILYETAIDLEMLRIVSATQSLDAVADNVQQLLYLTARGKVPAPHERKQINLAEAIARELNVYSCPAMQTLGGHVYAIDEFWSGWIPPTAVDAEPLAPQTLPATKPPTRHDVERCALAEMTNFQPGNQKPARRREGDGETAGSNYTRDYFFHCLGSSIRDFKKLPMEFAFSRAIGAALRAIRRATDRGRNPTTLEQQSIRFVFGAAGDQMTAVGGGRNEAMMRDAISLHYYFQIWPADDKSKKWDAAPAAMIANPVHFAEEISDLLADAGCILVLWPNHDVWVDIYRQLARINQYAEYGRELDATEKSEVDSAMTRMPEIPAGALSAIPAFAAEFAVRARQIHDYFGGRRISSGAAFDEMLRVVIDESREIQRGRNWDEDETPLGAIDRQLRAMQRWVAAGRMPTAEERYATREALVVVSSLKGLDRFEEWGRRIIELSQAFHDGPPKGSGESTKAAAPVVSKEDYGILLEDALRDCRRLSGPTMTRPRGPQELWCDIARELAVIQRMLDQGRVPTKRERGEIHAALTSVGDGVPNPCLTIHDFLLDIGDRLRRIDEFYVALVTQGPYAGKETANIDEPGLTCVTLGGEMRVAFVRTAGKEPGIYVSSAEKVVTREKSGEVEIDFMRYLPSTKNLMRLAPCKGGVPTEIQWNAHSDFLAYLIPGDTPQVGWLRTREVSDEGRVNAAAFAWSSKGSNLVLLDLQSRSIFRVNADTGKRMDLITLPEDISTNVAPRIAIAPGGEILAYTCCRTDGTIELSLIGFHGAKPLSHVRKQFPGASAVLPFWSPDGAIACLVIRDKAKAIVSLPPGDGDGEEIYRSNLLDGNFAPAWSSTGKYIAFFQTESADGAGLVLLDCDTREIIPLLKAGVLRGRLSFGEETLAIQNGGEAVILWPHLSHKRTVVEKF